MFYKIFVISFLTAACGDLSPEARNKVNTGNQTLQDMCAAGGLISKDTSVQKTEQKSDLWWYATLH